MNKNDCKQVLFYAAEIFNERMGSTFNEENLVLSCFQTSNQEEVFEQFCKQYFPDRLTDRYKEEGYFDFHASAFIGEGKNSVDGILLRTDIERTPATLYHILLHELAHVFCAHNELGGDNFYKRYCMDSTLSREEDGAINAGYAIWRELIAEVIAFEMDDNCFVVPLREKAALLRYYEEEFENGDRKRGLSMILCEALTSKECEMSATRNRHAQKRSAFAVRTALAFGFTSAECGGLVPLLSPLPAKRTRRNSAKDFTLITPDARKKRRKQRCRSRNHSPICPQR